VQETKTDSHRDRRGKLLIIEMKKTEMFQHKGMGEMRMVIEGCQGRRKVLIAPESQEAWCVISVEKCTRQSIF
jgi:hypothetical protein